MSSVVDASYDIAQSVKSLPITIKEALVDVYADVFVWLQELKESITGFYTDVFVWLQEIVGGISNLPSYIGETIKGIFIPDTDYIDTKFNTFVDNMQDKFNIDTGFFESLFDEEKPVEDISADYSIPGVGTFKLKFFDVKYLIQGVEYFRPFIRGFIVLLIALYNIKQIVGFFGYNAGVVAGRDAAIESSKKSQGG